MWPRQFQGRGHETLEAGDLPRVSQKMELGLQRAASPSLQHLNPVFATEPEAWMLVPALL